MLLEEIDAYQPKLEAVKQKGRAIIAASGHQLAQQDQIDSQLRNLEDSYLSLQATALQIKVSVSSFRYSEVTSHLAHLDFI